MSMPLVTILAGLALTVLGVGTFVGTGSSHYTALIPAGLGVVQLVLGLAARNDKVRKHAMHGAATVSLVGLVAGAIRGTPGWVQYLREGTELSTAALAILAMTVICLVHLALCVNSFIQARRAASKS